MTLVAAAALAGVGYRYYRDLEDHALVLEDRNTTISRNLAELEERNATITLRTRDLELAGAATIKERDRAEENLVGALEAVDGLLSSMGLTRVAHVPHIDKTARRATQRGPASVRPPARVPEGQSTAANASRDDLAAVGTDFAAAPTVRGVRAETRSGSCLARRTPRAPGRFAPAAILKVQAHTRMSRGSLYLQTGRVKEAAQEQEAALELLRDVLAERPNDIELRFLATMGNADLGTAALEVRDHEKAALHLGRARQLAEDLVRDRPTDAAYAGAYALVLNTLGVLHCARTNRTRPRSCSQRR